MEKIKRTISNEGREVNVDTCPECKEELIVQMKDGTEVFICENCKFVKKTK